MPLYERFDGFYVARYEGLNDSGSASFGVLLLKNGMVYGGDSHSAFMGDFKDHGNILTASVKVFGLEGRYRSIAGLDDQLWVLPDLRGNVQRGPSLPLHYEMTLGGERYDTQKAVSINLRRIAIV